MVREFARLVLKEVPVSTIQKLHDDVEVLSVGPLLAELSGGVLAIGPIAIVCSDVQGTASATPCRIGGDLCVVVQFDVAHPHQDLRVAASFALRLDDYAAMLERLKVPLDLARLEAAAK
jgi:hypothetical protein